MVPFANLLGAAADSTPQAAATATAAAAAAAEEGGLRAAPLGYSPGGIRDVERQSTIASCIVRLPHKYQRVVRLAQFADRSDEFTRPCSA